MKISRHSTPIILQESPAIIAVGNSMAYSGLGAWAIARHWVMQQALKTKTLNQYGFIIPWELAESGN